MQAATVTLEAPVEWGKGETISELVIRPTPRMFRGKSVRVGPDGGFDFEPYDLAQIGAVAAGYTPALVDKMTCADMAAVAQVVIGFFMGAPTTGTTP